MESEPYLPQQSHESAATKGTTFSRTCFNGVNTLSGVGILSVPYALSQGGWLSLILVFVVAILCWYTGILLRRCMDEDDTIKSYPDIGRKAFGHKGRILVSVFMYVELYLVAVEFLILEGDNLNKLFPDVMSFKFGEVEVGGKQGFILLTALVILPTTWLRSLGMLAYLSAGGVLASVVLVGCVLWVGVVDGVGFNEGDVLFNWGGLPTAISLITFCYCGHVVFPTLYHSMQDKTQFSKVLLVCFVTSTLTYGSMAVIGYLMYGENLKSQVTLNLPTTKISTQIAIYTTLINPFTKYALVISPISKAIEDKFHLDNRRYLSILLRTSIMITTLVVASTIPFFAYVMAFIGAFLSVTVSMLLPCLCYLKINKAARNLGFELVVIVGILISGSFTAVVGTYISLKQIITHL
ncbi:amino acid transporter AVT1I-like [Mercurialis annua]|uniref:amino acid transporter AVT1I-like n=1 Tax=Mercurialis annua TaxID=3986 RepID=UPI0021603509|nr:amino acid transporter AVT1I-like [Mercurialis annua]